MSIINSSVYFVNELEKVVHGNFDTILIKFVSGILGGCVSAISAGGSKGVFLKINTFGEEAFLSKLRELL